MWLEETNSTFPMLLDTPRQIYHTLGLPRSIAKVFNCNALSLYGEANARGEKIPQQFENIHDDPQQLGADFIASKSQTGEVVFSLIHRSVDSADRPNVQDLLKFLQNST
uniref:Uncharacterized protein n=1 Tax=Ciona savignyi TaxID=51511 RepID=H2YZ48_CIOSA